MTRSRPSQLQPYIERIGEQVFAPPFLMKQANIEVLIVRSRDRRYLQDVVDRELNRPWREAFAHRGVHYDWQASQGWFAVVLLDVRNIRPQRLPDDPARWREVRDRTGYSQAVCEALITTVAAERELLVMIPVHDRKQPPADPNCQQWYVPLVLNDSVPAIVAGRELFGYPKIYGRFMVDGVEVSDDHRPPLFGSDALPWSSIVIQAHGPKQRRSEKWGPVTYQLGLIDVLEMTNPGTVRRRQRWPRSDRHRPVPEVEKDAGPGRLDSLRLTLARAIAPDTHELTRRVSVWSDPMELGDSPDGDEPSDGDERSDGDDGTERSRRRDWYPDLSPGVGVALTEDLDDIGRMLNRTVEYLFLRQYRDPNNADRASYQAVVAGRATLAPGTSAPFQKLDRPVTLRVPPLVEGPGGAAGHNRLVEKLGVGEHPSIIGRFGVADTAINVGSGYIMWDRP